MLETVTSYYRSSPESSKMKAVIYDHNELSLKSVPRPSPGPSEVLVRVAMLGLCRTDLYAIQGKIKTELPLIPGHEFSGIVTAVGNKVSLVKEGDAVAVNPVLPCGTCQYCATGDSQLCQTTLFLGVDLAGACSEYVLLPETALFQVPEGVSKTIAAFLEPVAASLAVLNAEIHPDQSGLIWGGNRIAELTRRIMQARGFKHIAVHDQQEIEKFPDNKYDFVIETRATTEAFQTLTRVVKPRGRVILKSRQYQPVSFVLKDILPKEPVFQVVNYGDFQEAAQVLFEGKINVDDLVGEIFGLEDFQAAFASAEECLSHKTFISLETQ